MAQKSICIEWHKDGAAGQCESKSGITLLPLRQMLIDFQKLFHRETYFTGKFTIKPSVKMLSRLECVTTPPCEM